MLIFFHNNSKVLFTNARKKIIVQEIIRHSNFFSSENDLLIYLNRYNFFQNVVHSSKTPFLTVKKHTF